MNKLNYSLLTQKDIPSTITCVIKVFLYEEPMTKTLGITESEFKIFVKAICKKTAKEKMSYVCKENNKVIGFCLNEDLITKPFPESTRITSKMNPIFKLLKELDKEFLENKKVSKKIFFHLFMIGSLKEYRNQGIAKKLTANSLALAKKMKFKEVVTEATSTNSQNLLKKHFNFREFTEIKYGKFKFSKRLPFKDLGEESCKLMTLKLP